ncbi:hypothetical protein [Streptomyces sp. RFCAC02]|uniref:hypothetical protein n=1 Tax=Streptomyces sp. RFCAC02 TaxID=2499143 RepID=UPI001021B0FA|nr:hypothetical protein [Streptomyces sp. RFCAC02]
MTEQTCSSGETPAVPDGPADALELQELRALAAHRARRSRGEDIGIPHEEAFRRVFGAHGP